MGIFVAATRQHVGKSTTSLGLLGALLKRVEPRTVSFFKPVGQQHVPVDLSDGRTIRIDKDCLLAKDHFGLACPYGDMSPLLVPRGYTKRFIDGEVDVAQQEAAVLDAWGRLTAEHPNAVVEGTGHMGVGSIVGLDNARVAKLLGLEVLLVCEGGLGSAFDELALNVAMCERQGVRVRAVIVNKVVPEKIPMLRHYFGRALEPLGVPLAGLVPREPFLGTPSMMDFARLFATPLISGESHRLRHCDGVQLISASGKRFRQRLAAGDYQKKLLVIHGSRADVIEGVMDHHLVMQEERLFEDHGFQGGIVFTGSQRGWDPSPAVLRKLEESSVPTLHAQMQTADAVERIHRATAKLNAIDVPRTEAAVAHIQKHVDLDSLGLYSHLVT